MLVVEFQTEELAESKVSEPLLFQVWIDVNCGFPPGPDWWWNSEPQTLAGALKESAELRQSVPPWIHIICVEGENPRPDGRWDNPF